MRPRLADMETGNTHINAPAMGAEIHLPFGGVQRTGLQRARIGTDA